MFCRGIRCVCVSVVFCRSSLIFFSLLWRFAWKKEHSWISLFRHLDCSIGGGECVVLMADSAL